MSAKITEAAIKYASKGWPVVTVLGKVPTGGDGWQLRAAKDAESARRLFTSCSRDGVGCKLGPEGGIIDVECDDDLAELAYQSLFDGQPPRTPTFKSTRGTHRIFRHRDGLPNPDKAVFKIGNLEFRTGNGEKAAQSVFPPSGNREWVIHPDECELADITDDVLARIFERLNQKAKPQANAKRSTKAKLSPSDANLKRARSYLAKIPPAVSGERGHDQTFKAVCRLVAFGLTRSEVRDLIHEWNQSCDPPWSDAELEHKIDEAFKENPDPMPDRPTASPVTSSQSGANEAGDDPHRLARLFLIQYFTLFNGLQKLVWWQGSYWRWDGLRYHELKKHELIAMLTGCIKAEFDRINIWELENWIPKNDEEQPPKVKPVTKALLNNVDNAVASIVSLPDSKTMPDWLCGDPPFPAKEVLSTQSTLLHLPSLITGAPEGIKPTPMLFSANCLGYDFDPVAVCPNWMAFLRSLWNQDDESIQSLQEWFGYLLLPDTRQHKLLMLIGPPRSGKGTITRVLQLLLGEGNVASPTLSSLAGPFGLWPLLNKYVALIPDARLSGRDDAIAVVERLLSLTGEDPQDIHRKNLPTLTGVRMPIRFVLMSNELPNLRDASGAFMTRVVLLMMTESFIGREDRTLGQRLAGELPGILNWSIEGWKRLNERGYFIQPGSATEMLDDLENLSSPIKQFIADSCDVGPAYESSVEQLYASWKSWCESNHRDHTGTNQTFGRDLRAAIPQLRGIQRNTLSGKERRYIGIGIRREIPW